MTAWCIWYADGASFSSDDGEPHDAPRWGVICVAAYSGDHGRMIWHGTDFYCWADEWVSMDTAGLLDYLGNIPGKEKVVLMGRHVPSDVFKRVYQLADQDPRLPPRTSRSASEDRRQQL